MNQLPPESAENTHRPQIISDIDSLVGDLIPSNLDGWLGKYKTWKIIHDGLWGTFKIERHELAILDTPLLQRLRMIRQTGAVFLTYPSAQHTRFEHTIGVLSRAYRMCAAIQMLEGDGRFSQTEVNNLRAAALLHDTGHGPFSHTSEQFYSANDDIAEAKSSDPKQRFKHSGAGEVLSALIVDSEPFRTFVRRINAEFGVQLDCDSIIQYITGSVPDDRLYLSEIIHGPFDADKLDYMPRDGMFSGLKMHIDVDRLFYSMNVYPDPDGERATRLAGSSFGISPLIQILFNKMLLHMGMYHHHKVRTVDCMLWAAFLLAQSRDDATLGGVNIQNTVDFLKLTDDRVLIPELTNDDEIREIVTDIRKRNLWKRALVIARRTIPEAMHNEASADDEQGLFPGFVNKLAGNSPANIQARNNVAEEIWKQAGKPCQKHEVWLDVPKPPSLTEAKKMWIRVKGESKPRLLESYIPIDQWVALYGSHMSTAHVFCPPKHGQSISDASREVLKAAFGLDFNPVAIPAWN